LRDLGSRKDRNIFELEINEIIADSVMIGNGQFFALKILNSLLSRLSFFTVFVRREGFTDPFFRLLDFFDKSTKVF
jgi:hypothetical protein